MRSTPAVFAVLIAALLIFWVVDFAIESVGKISRDPKALNIQVTVAGKKYTPDQIQKLKSKYESLTPEQQKKAMAKYGTEIEKAKKQYGNMVP